jgi:hypothetical protein
LKNQAGLRGQGRDFHADSTLISYSVAADLIPAPAFPTGRTSLWQDLPAVLDGASEEV